MAGQLLKMKRNARRSGRGVLALMVFCAAGMACAAEPTKPSNPSNPSSLAKGQVDVVSAEFGVFDTGNSQEMLFTPTLRVPHREGQRYGWVIELRTSRRSVSVREEYLLPNTGKAPPVLKTDDPSREVVDIPQMRRNQVSQRQLVPVDGKIYGEWAIGPNEPGGHRHLQVVIEGEVAASFEYDVK